MAEFRFKLKDWCNEAADCIWPRLYGKSEPEPKEQDFLAGIGDSAALQEMGNIVEKRGGQVDERFRNVEMKLIALLGLTSILSAVVIASFTAVSTMEIVKNFPVILIWIAYTLILYISINLLHSLWATVNGLVRRDYKQVSCEEMVLKSKENAAQFMNRVFNIRLNHVKYNDWVLNRKVEEMAIAHKSLKNVLVGSGGIILVSLAIAIYKLAS
jgi:hypothetical protein